MFSKQHISHYQPMPLKRREEQEVEVKKEPLVHLEANIIYFFDEMNGPAVMEAIRFIDLLEASGEYDKIIFKLNSGGGSIYDGLCLYDRLRECKLDIVMVGTGLVGSMAFVVYLAGDMRYCSENVRFLNHQAKAGFDGKDLTEAQIKIEAEETKVLETIGVNIIASRTLLTPKVIKNSIKLGDKYIGAKDALSMGIVHEIIKENDTKKNGKPLQ